MQYYNTITDDKNVDYSRFHIPLNTAITSYFLMRAAIQSLDTPASYVPEVGILANVSVTNDSTLKRQIPSKDQPLLE